MFELKIENKLKLNEFFIKDKIGVQKGLEKLTSKLLDFIVEGSLKETRVPPVLTKRLRASGSAFVNSKLIRTTINISSLGTPNETYTTKTNEGAIGFNTPYAAKWHEIDFNPGPVSLKSGNVGTKYVEMHLNADRELLFDIYTKEYRKVVGT